MRQNKSRCFYDFIVRLSAVCKFQKNMPVILDCHRIYESSVTPYSSLMLCKFT